MPPNQLPQRQNGASLPSMERMMGIAALPGHPTAGRRSSLRKRVVLGMAAFAAAGASFADTCDPIRNAAAAYAKAERFTVKMAMTSRGETHSTEVLMSPEGMYIKAGEQWVRSPVAINRKELIDANKSTFSDCRQVGKEVVDGAPTLIYQFTGKADGEPAMQGRMWIGTADDLPRRIDGKTKDGDITQSIRYDVQAPRGGTVDIPGLNQLKGLFGK
jgi:hypothetical protein